MLTRLTACLLCLIATATAEVQLLKWFKSYSNLSDYSRAFTRLTHSTVSCLGSVSAAVSDVQLVTYSPDIGLCTAYKCALGLTQCRKCRYSLADASNEPVWLRELTCLSTVQHRVSASVSFYRNWSEYKAGFGEGPSANFWIGLDSLRSLTYPTPRKLLILMRAWNDSWSWAQYSSFSVGPESDNYRLDVSGFSGSAGVGDAFNYNIPGFPTVTNGQPFSTYDKDNDRDPDSCARKYPGGWWFQYCLCAHLNGVYQPHPQALSTGYAQGLVWCVPFGFFYSQKEVEMLV